MTRSDFLRHAHAITRCKNIEYFGSYRKAFAHVLRTLHAQGPLVYGFRIVEPARVWA